MGSIQVLKFITGHPLNRGRPGRALARYVRWQLGSRIAGRDLIEAWVNGSRFLARAGETGITGNIYAGLQEFADMGYLLHALRPEDAFVDVGANVGSYTILAGAAIGARGWAFEPVPATFRRLDDNVRLNRLDGRVRHMNIAIGAAGGSLAFTRDLDTVNHALADGDSRENSLTVEVRTLDEVLAGGSPALVKMDVEGFETAVLQGASRTLARESLHSVIMELNGSGRRYGHDERRIVELMAGHGFSTHTYEPIARRLIDLDGGTLAEGNTLFIRDPQRIREKLRTAPQFEILGRAI